MIFGWYGFQAASNVIYTLHIIHPILKCRLYPTNQSTDMNQVKQYRTALGLSQQALAQAVGVSRQTVNQLENQDYNPTLSLCIRIAKALNTDLNILFWENENDEEET